MLYTNEIKKDEVYNIYRIEYMPSSNWVLGTQRMIWVMELTDEEAKRSLYVGDPFSPEFRAYQEEAVEYREKWIEDIRSGKQIFANRYDPNYIYEFLEGCEVWNWSKKKSNCIMIDGPIFDVAFFTKDCEGKDKICRYYFEEMPMDPWIINQFDSFFETMPSGIVEPVSLNTEMIERSPILHPGNYDDNTNRNEIWNDNNQRSD